MSKYECQQCQETSDLPFAGGKCTRCGSLNIRNIAKHPVSSKNKSRKGSTKSVLMIILWAYIIYELWQRLT